MCVGKKQKYITVYKGIPSLITVRINAPPKINIVFSLKNHNHAHIGITPFYMMNMDI